MTTSNSTEYAKKDKSMMFLHLDCSMGARGSTEMNNDFVVQTLVLKSTRVLFVDAASSLAYPDVFVKLSSFSQGHVTNNLNICMLPLLTDTTKTDNLWCPDIKISLSKKLPHKIAWNVVRSSGVNVPNDVIEFVQVVFELEMS